MLHWVIRDAIREARLLPIFRGLLPSSICSQSFAIRFLACRMNSAGERLQRFKKAAGDFFVQHDPWHNGQGPPMRHAFHPDGSDAADGSITAAGLDAFSSGRSHLLCGRATDIRLRRGCRCSRSDLASDGDAVAPSGCIWRCAYLQMEGHSDEARR